MSRLAGQYLAEEPGVSETTVRRWKKRDRVHDRLSQPHELQTTLSPEQGAIVVELRKTLLLSADDLLCVVHEFIKPDGSRSSLIRLLRRYDLTPLRQGTLKPMGCWNASIGESKRSSRQHGSGLPRNWRMPSVTIAKPTTRNHPSRPQPPRLTAFTSDWSAMRFRPGTLSTYGRQDTPSPTACPSARLLGPSR